MVAGREGIKSRLCRKSLRNTLGGGEGQVPAQSPLDNSEGPWLGRALACGVHPQLTCHATASWEIDQKWDKLSRGLESDVRNW